MYACICAAVTDDEVRQAIADGAHTVERVGVVTSAGTGCGSCHDHLCDMIQSLTGDRRPSIATAT